jgi:parallel beta-helix repeat protein
MTLIRRKIMKRKIIGIFVCMLLISTVLPVSGNVIMKSSSKPLSLGTTLYVGGSDPGNYSSIQEAIDDSIDGDTVFVYDDSSPYFETLIIDKSINLIGESRETTIIDANEKEDCDVILVKVDGVTVKGFTLQNTGSGVYPDYDNGIEIHSNNNIIIDNIIKETKMGIQLSEEIKYKGHENNLSNNNIIEGNIIIENYFAGIYLISSNDNLIKQNIISKNAYHGVFLLTDNCRNQIVKNIISNHSQVGVYILGGSNNTILQNHIVGNQDFGIAISSSSLNYINYNNIYDNARNAIVDVDSIVFIVGTLKDKERYFSHSWDENYWGRPYTGPKLILSIVTLAIPTIVIGGILDRFFGIFPVFFIPFPKFDWHPASEPYDV